MVFGALAAHNGNTAVAERVADRTARVKRRSSFEPEAAEEVKEDDKEEKGFSMWESISAQPSHRVFPAERRPTRRRAGRFDAPPSIIDGFPSPFRARHASIHRVRTTCVQGATHRAAPGRAPVRRRSPRRARCPAGAA